MPSRRERAPSVPARGIAAKGHRRPTAGRSPAARRANPRLGWPAIGLGAAVILAAPGTVADADIKWRLAVSAAGAVDLRHVYVFPFRRACEEERDDLRRGVGRVLDGHGEDTSVGRAARRLRVGACEAVLGAR